VEEINGQENKDEGQSRQKRSWAAVRAEIEPAHELVELLRKAMG